MTTGEREAHFLIAPFVGAVCHYHHVMRHLMGLGYDVHLWTMEPIDQALVDELAPGLTCHRLPLRRGRYGAVAQLRTIVSSIRLGLRRPGAIFTTWSIQTNLLCGLPLRLLGRRCVFLMAGMGTVFTSDALRFRLMRRLVAPTYSWMFRGENSRVIVQNSDDLDLVTGELGVPRDRVHQMWGCGADPWVYPFAERLSARRPRVVLVPARLIREKGIFEAAEASRILYQRGVEHELWFTYDVDPANPHSLTRADADALPSRSPAIRVLGYQPSITPLLEAAYAVCLPTYREGLPTALIEASAYGRPIVTTDVIGTRDLVSDGETGLVVPPRDPRALADALERVLVDEALAERLRQAAHQRFLARCTRTATLAQALGAYHSLGVPARRG
ncbi:MAG TPA: glycosyltransferase [Kofleriaceae bacterium]|nr:glycosyltransferase [Kofleriaceae bacterium]